MKKPLTPEQKEARRLYSLEYKQKNKGKIKNQNKVYRELNKDKIKEWREANKKNIKEKNIEYRKNNREKLSLNDKVYKEVNKEKIKKQNADYRKNNKSKIKQWYDVNKDKRRAYKTEYNKKRLLNDPLFKLKTKITSLIRQSFKRKNHIKKTKTSEILSCSFDEFKLHVESLWESWMNWDNYGNPKDGIFEPNKTWDIDHIIPLNTALTEDDVIRLNHYTNLQPLCSYINRFVKRGEI